MFIFFAFFQNQEVSQVFTLPSYFIPIFLTILVLGLILGVVTIVLGVSQVKKAAKSSFWFLLTGLSLFLYFIHWFVMGFAKLIGYESATWITLSFLNFFALLAVIFVLIGLAKTKESL